MGKTTIFIYLEKLYLDEFEESRLIPIYVSFKVQEFHELVRLNIEENIIINYFSRSLYITIAKHIRDVLTRREYSILHENFDEDELHNAKDTIDIFIANLESILTEVHESVLDRSGETNLNFRIWSRRRGSQDLEVINRYTMLPPSLSQEFADLVIKLKEILDIRKFVFLCDESFAIFRRYGL